MLDILQQLEQRFSKAITSAFGPEFTDIDPLIRTAANPDFGDYQANVAMSLSKRVNQKPRDVAQTICNHLQIGDLCQAPQVAGPGFINLTLKMDYLAKLVSQLMADEKIGIENVPNPQCVVVDYSSPNVAKEMHVGHLRSTAIGDAIVRVLECMGHQVIRQNHIGDWGTQFGMLIEYLIREQGDNIDQLEIPDLNRFYQDAKQRFDDNEEFAEASRKRVVALQGGDEQTLQVWKALVKESEKHFNQAYRRLGVTLTDEHLKPESSYNDQLPAVLEELEKQNLTSVSDGAVVVYPDGFTGRDDQPMPVIIRKSDGGFLYATTDLAAIRYRIDQLKAGRVIYVTDARQKQHFAMVFKIAEMAKWVPDTVLLEHVSFGTILGPDNKPFKTRTGGTVKLTDLLDEAESRALAIVGEKNADITTQRQQEVAHVVGIGAIKYSDLACDRIKDYVFSWPRMLAMEGNTAPYLQYAYARICSIFRKAGIEPSQLVHVDVIIEHAAEKNLSIKISQFPNAVVQVADSLEPHRLCNYIYELASAFSGFYENCPVLRAESESLKQSRLALCDLTARTLKLSLDLLGIEVLDRM